MYLIWDFSYLIIIAFYLIFFLWACVLFIGWVGRKIYNLLLHILVRFFFFLYFLVYIYVVCLIRDLIFLCNYCYIWVFFSMFIFYRWVGRELLIKYFICSWILVSNFRFFILISYVISFIYNFKFCVLLLFY